MEQDMCINCFCPSVRINDSFCSRRALFRRPPHHSCLSTAGCGHTGPKVLTPAPDILVTRDLWPATKEDVSLDGDFPAVCPPSGTKSRLALLTRALGGTMRRQTAGAALPAAKQHFLSPGEYVGKWLFLSNLDGCLLILRTQPRLLEFRFTGSSRVHKKIVIHFLLLIIII